MSTWKRWLVGIGLILSAVTGYLVAVFDDKEETAPDLPAAIQQVHDGVTLITKE